MTMGFGASFGYSRNEEAHPSILFNGSALTGLLVRTVAKGGNLEINVGPTGDGRIPSSMQTPLRAIGRWLAVNGEAVYSTLAFPFGSHVPECETSAGVERCYTYRNDTDSQGGSTVFVIYLGWPAAATTLLFPLIRPTAKTTVSLVGRPDLGNLTYTNGGHGGLALTLPQLLLTGGPAQACLAADAWVFRFSGLDLGDTSAGSAAETVLVGTHGAASDATVAASVASTSGIVATSLACDWATDHASLTRGNFSCSPSAVVGVSAKISDGPDSGVGPNLAAAHSIEARTYVYRADEPTQAERFRVASITMGMGGPSQGNYSQQRLALALQHLAEAARGGAALALLPEEFAGSREPVAGYVGDAWPHTVSVVTWSLFPGVTCSGAVTPSSDYSMSNSCSISSDLTTIGSNRAQAAHASSATAIRCTLLVPYPPGYEYRSDLPATALRSRPRSRPPPLPPSKSFHS